MADGLDKRLHAVRDDLADAALKGRVEALRFVEGQPYHVTATIAPVHPRPSHDADLDTQALWGEAVRVFDIADGWAWCQLAGDGYVGYVPAEMLTAGQPAAATHKVIKLEAFVYTEPNARSKPIRPLLHGTTFAVVSETDTFFELAGGGFIGREFVTDIEDIERELHQTANSFMDAPYLWGGKSVRGIDCSGLVQLSLQRAGIPCPRDTDMQARDLPGGIAVAGNILKRLQRGDIVYWPGHVGIMVCNDLIVHASGTRMSTKVEWIKDVAERSRKDGPIVSAVKRLMDAKL